MSRNAFSELPQISALIALTLIEGLTHFGLLYPDSGAYLANVGFFQGSSAPNQFRLLRPIVPFLVSLVGRFMDLRTAFAVVNLLFWCGSAVVMLSFVRRLTHKGDVALLSSGFLLVAYPMLVYGDAVLTDMAGFFFVLVGVDLIVNWKVLSLSYANVLAGGGIMTVGILSRETVACVFVLALIWVIISRESFVKLILFVGIPMAALFAWATVERLSLLGFVLVQQTYSSRYQPLSWSGRILTWLYTLRIAFRPELLLLAFVGLVFALRKKDWVKYAVIICGISAFLLAVPGPVDYRFTFLLYPAILPLAAIGTIQLARLISEQITVSQAKNTTILLTALVFLAYAAETNWLALKFVSIPFG